MIKFLLMLLLAVALVICMIVDANAGTRHYDMQGVGIRKGYESTWCEGDACRIEYLPSCGAAKRLMQDHHTLVIDDDRGQLWVDGLRWTPVGDFVDDSYDPDVIALFHTSSHGVLQKTHMQIDVYVNQTGVFGTLTITGRTIGGRACSDSINIDGLRR